MPKNLLSQFAIHTHMAEFTTNQETPSPIRRLGQPHQLFQLGLRMDHHFYRCFFTHFHLLASSITSAPTQPLPHGSTPRNASGVIPPSRSHSKYLASLTKGYTRKQRKKKSKSLDELTTLPQPHHSLRCVGRLISCNHFQHKVN